MGNTLAHGDYLRRLAKLISVTVKLFLDNYKSPSFCLSIHSIRKMKWTIPFFLGMIWCMQLVGQAANVRERLTVDDDIVDRDIAEDIDRSECHDGENPFGDDPCNQCSCYRGSWICNKMFCPLLPEKESDRTGIARRLERLNVDDDIVEKSDRTGIARRLKESEPCLGYNAVCKSSSECCESGSWIWGRKGCCRLGEDGIGRCNYASCGFLCSVYIGSCDECYAKACGILNKSDQIRSDTQDKDFGRVLD